MRKWLASITLLGFLLAGSGWGTLRAQGQAGQKAVLIIGPVRTISTWSQAAEEKKMEAAAAVLIAHGISVSRFYYPNTSWQAITAAANGASYLLYRGEGILLDNNPGPDVYGGFWLGDQNEQYAILPNRIRSELHLAPGALVMLYACWTAGSAGWEANIDSATAQTRVTEYSSPFLDSGADGYFSNWEADSFANYLQYVFSGDSYGQAYLRFVNDHQRLEQYSYPQRPGLALWLDSDLGSGGVVYDNAFVGDPNMLNEIPLDPNFIPRLYLPVVVR